MFGKKKQLVLGKIVVEEPKKKNSVKKEAPPVEEPEVEEPEEAEEETSENKGRIVSDTLTEEGKHIITILADAPILPVGEEFPLEEK